MSLYVKILYLIETQLYKIESAITCKNIEIIEESDEIKMFNQEMVLVEYSPDFERRIENWNYAVRYDNDYYIHRIYPSISKVLKFLNSDFDYEQHKLLAIDWKKKKQENKEGYLLFLNTWENNLKYRAPIKESIEIVLEYYSKQSSKLTEYINLFSKDFRDIAF